ncbi:MAG: DUF5131 family protein [Planctomycetia bacterium]|nr:DUF5131 family protein [Planctomycetia bacterium]
MNSIGQPNYANGFKLTLHEEMLHQPLPWRKPRMVFVNSTSDLFHRDVPNEFIQHIFAVMRQASQHRFQVLTKWSKRLADLATEIDWPTTSGWASVLKTLITPSASITEDNAVRQ